MNAFFKSLARTVVPLAVGLVITLGLRAGFDLHGYAPQITAVVTALYYALIRVLEQYVNVHFGWLLGVAAQPLYPTVAGKRVR